MKVAERIQALRKAKGISQEELADKLGVSRQAVSKWKSGQSSPDLEKILLLSTCFDVTTDYLLKGIEDNNSNLSETNMPAKRKADARIFTAVGTAINCIGLISAIIIWMERQTSSSVAIGFMIMILGCLTHIVGQIVGENIVIAKKVVCSNKYMGPSFDAHFMCIKFYCGKSLRILVDSQPHSSNWGWYAGKL